MIMEANNLPQVTQLIVGYYRNTSDGSHDYNACGSVTLVKDGTNIILVDCAGPWDNRIILQKLAEQNLHPNDISYLICTHGHIDHIGNLNLFNNAKILLDHDIATKADIYEALQQVNGLFNLSPNVDVISTPGHTNHDLSVVIKNVPNKGVVVISGDIFESEADLRNPDLWRCSSWNKEIQESSRKRILKLANFIVPGHGVMFENLKQN